MFRTTRPATPHAKIDTLDSFLEAQIESSLDAVLALYGTPAVAAYNRRLADLFELPENAEADAVVRAILGRLKNKAALLADVLASRAHPRAPIEGRLELVDGRAIEARSSIVQNHRRERVGRMWTFRDLTDQRRSEGALRASHALLATTERIAHVGGWDWDIAHDRLHWSEETTRMFGRDPLTHAPSVADFVSAIHPDDRARVENAMRASLEQGAPFGVQFRIVRPDGRVRVIDAVAEVTRGEGGRPARMTGTSRDVTEMRAVEDGLRFANALSAAQLESSPDGILVVGSDRRIVSFNRKFLELWMVPEAVVASGSDEKAVEWVLDSLKDPLAFLGRLEHLYSHPEETAHEEIDLKDGRVFERHSGPLPIADGAAPGRIFFFRDITARKKAEAEIARMAREDGLTGLANRGVLVEAVQQAIARAGRSDETFALVTIDLDRFKDVNDTLGHPAGDLLLQGVADRLRATVRETDLVARFGGDEFAVVQAHVTEPTQVAAFAERLGRALREPFAVLGDEIRIDASMGLAVYNADVPTAEELLSQADLALYRAKADGRGTYRFFAEGMDVEVRSRLALASELRAAIESDQLYLVYQPQVDLATGRIAGVEALVRWRHPRRGIVSPGEFIPVAEKCGLMVALGRWVLREACRQTRRWIDDGIAPDTVAVNVSGAQFRTPHELENTVAAALAAHGVPAHRLEVELTESVLMEGWLEQRDVLRHLRSAGIQVAIDDFGTGFSSLQYLHRFPVDRIKIAQCFVADLADGSCNAPIVRATVGLARELGLRVIAEGVETRAQLTMLVSLGCGDAQGFYFAKPVPPEELRPLLRRGHVDLRGAAATLLQDGAGEKLRRDSETRRAVAAAGR